MRYTGIQPQYFPRLHYFARILNADIFALRDDCQFVRKHKYPDGHIGPSYQAHTPIKQTGNTHLLAVPTAHEGLLPIADTRLSYQNTWATVHLNTVKYIYARAPNFAGIYSDISAIVKVEYTFLPELTIITTLWALLRLMGEPIPPVETITIAYVNERLRKQRIFRLREIRRATDLSCSRAFDALHANEKILAIIKELGATEDYCGGTAMAAYMNQQAFQHVGVGITVQNWQCPHYPQQFSSHGFIPNLSIIDLLMNVSAGQAIDILTQ